MTTTTESITLEQIEALSEEASEHGDLRTVALCERAMLAVYDARRGQNASPRDANAVDLEAVVEIISDAEAMED